MDKDIKKIKEFIKSDLDEAEFFGLSKDNTITLGDYQEKMIDIDRNFQQMAQFEVFSIKRKCDWVKEVWFYGMKDHTGQKDEFFLPTIYLIDKDGKEIFLTRDNINNGTYEVETKIPRIYLLSSEVRQNMKRKQEIYKIQTELLEIEKIANLIYKSNGLEEKDSISYNFHTSYRPESGLYLFNFRLDNITAYLKENRKNYDKPLVKDKDKAKLLRKVLIKND